MAEPTSSKDSSMFSGGTIEMTAGVLEENGKIIVLNPSLTLSEKVFLSLEEKFQGGTGTNITPVPCHLLSNTALALIKEQLAIVFKRLSLKNYARIDFFYNTQTSALTVIEANTLPALTPSTVLYHQALAENPPLKPLELIEKIIFQSIMCC